jgi:hypothetical protein
LSTNDLIWVDRLKLAARSRNGAFFIRWFFFSFNVLFSESLWEKATGSPECDSIFGKQTDYEVEEQAW